MTKKQQKISVLGAGSWGCALGKVLLENGHDVLLWSIDEPVVDELNQARTNERYLPGTIFSENVRATSDLAEAVHFSDILLMVIPTGAMRQVARQMDELIQTPKLLIHASKGLELGTHERISEVLTEEIAPDHRSGIGVLSGPSHAEEVVRGDITTVTAASEDLNVAEKIQDLFMNDYFRVYTNDDVIGVELGAALKNIIAIGAGALVGLGYGDNALAALVTRGIVEIKRLGLRLGADSSTFDGLSGVGDLIVTCKSSFSRNWQAGKLIGEGYTTEELEEKVGMVVEGVYTVRAAQELATELNVQMPITTAIYRVLYEGGDPREELTRLMRREGKSE